MEALLEVFDTNNSGSLDAGDTEWGRFGIWIDSDTDGFSDPGEFTQLEDLGIIEISLEYESVEDKIWSPYEDVLIHGETLVTFEDGRSVIAQDTEFKFETIEGKASFEDVEEEPFNSMIDELIKSQVGTESKNISTIPSIEDSNDNNSDSIETNSYSWEELIDKMVEESDRNEEDNNNYEQDEQRNDDRYEEDLNADADVQAESEFLDDEDISEESI